MKNILAVPIDNSATAYHRVIQPLHYLKEDGYNIQFLGEKENQLAQFEWADILYIQCLYAPGAYQFYYELKKKGKKIIVDFDDDYINIPKDSPEQTEIIDSVTGEVFRFSPELRAVWVKMFVELADQVVVTTSELKNLYQSFNKEEIKIIPNCISVDMRRDLPKQVHPETRILFTGSASHLPDLELLKEPLTKIYESYKDKVSFYFQGPIDFSKIFEFPFETFIEVPYGEYLNHIQYLDADIGLLPLKENLFNKAKSNLKYCQLTMLDIACVVSDFGPYSDINSGIDGYKCKTSEDWFNALSLLIENKNLRNQCINSALEKIYGRYLIENHLDKWRSLIS